MSAPFDTVADVYDAQFTERRLGRWLRAAVWECLADWFRPGDRVLDLGCGTGEDAVWLARRGSVVTAVDASSAMLEAARRKAEAAGVADRIEFVLMDLNRVPGTDARISDVGARLQYRTPKPGFGYPTAMFDGALADFGVLNCLRDRRRLAEVLAREIRPGGTFIAVVMGPFCLWEIAWHLLRGRWRTAFRRLRNGTPARIGEGAVAWVEYPSPRRLGAEFAPYFRPVRTMGLGVFLPPTYLDSWVERWPRFFAYLERWERRFRRFPPWTWLGDHYLMVFRRREEP
jgi:SAM-dependent methyltransferase